MPRTKRSRPTPIEIVYVPSSDPRAVGAISTRQGAELLLCIEKNAIPYNLCFSITISF